MNKEGEEGTSNKHNPQQGVMKNIAKANPQRCYEKQIPAHRIIGRKFCTRPCPNIHEQQAGVNILFATPLIC